MAADNLRVQFIFAKGCGACDAMKAVMPATGKSNYDTIKEYLESKGVVVNAVTAPSLRKSDMPSSPAILGRCSAWFPSALILPQRLYEKIDQFSVNEVMECLHVYNGNIVKRSNGDLYAEISASRSRSDRDGYARFMSNYLSSPQYAKARSLLARLSGPVPGSAGAAGSSSSSVPSVTPVAKPAPIFAAPPQTPETVESIRQQFGDLVISNTMQPTGKTSTKPEYCSTGIGFKPRPRYH